MNKCKACKCDIDDTEEFCIHCLAKIKDVMDIRGYSDNYAHKSEEVIEDDSIFKDKKFVKNVLLLLSLIVIIGFCLYIII